MITEPESSPEDAPKLPDPVDEIRLSMFDEGTSPDPASPEARSLAVVQDFHRYLVGRGWEFDSADALAIWHWPPSRMEEDGYSILTTDVWIDVEDPGAGPDQLHVNISLVGEKDNGRDEWTLEFELSNFDGLPLDQAEAFRIGKSLPAAWDGSNSEPVAIPDEVASLLRELYRADTAEAWLHGRNSHLAGGRPIDFLALGHVAAVVYALKVEIQGGMA